MELLETFMHNIKSGFVCKFAFSSYIFSTLRKITQEVLSTLTWMVLLQILMSNNYFLLHSKFATKMQGY